MKMVIGLAVAGILIMTLFFQSADARVFFVPFNIVPDEDNNVYALVAGNETVENCVHVFSAEGNETIIPQSNVIDIATDGEGNLYMLYEILYYEKRNISIMKREPGGKTSIVFYNNSSEFNPGYMIGSMAAGESGDLFIYDYYIFQDNVTGLHASGGFGMPVEGSTRMVHMDSGGNILKAYNVYNMTDPSYCKLCLSVDVNGTIYASNYTTIVRIIHPDDTIGYLGNPGANDDQYIIYDISAGRDGFIYLAECSAQNGGRVRKLSPDGDLIATWNGCGPDQFVEGYSVAAGKNGRVYVADRGNHRIVWFDSNNYSYIKNSSSNLEGKGVLWDTVVAYENHTVTTQREVEEMTNAKKTPGLTMDMALASIMLISIILYAVKRRL